MSNLNCPSTNLYTSLWIDLFATEPPIPKLNTTTISLSLKDLKRHESFEGKFYKKQDYNGFILTWSHRLGSLGHFLFNFLILTIEPDVGSFSPLSRYRPVQGDEGEV